MNGKPGTKAELEALEAARDYLTGAGMPYAKHLGTLHAKLTAPFKPRPTLPDARVVEDALGVLKVEAGDGWWASTARKLAAVGATVEDAKVIGTWLATQRWAKDFTIDRVISGWPSYLARAKGNRAPESGWSRPEFGG